MIEILNRYTKAVLYSAADAQTVAEAVAAAVKSGAHLRGAHLGGAHLGGANLREADLYGADLRGAGLRGADLGGEAGKLKANGFFSAGPLGSCSDMLMAFHTDNDVFVRTGCFFGSLEVFRAKVIETHGAESIHGRLYLAATDLVALKFAEQAY